MQIRNRLGQYAGSYWKSLRTERKVYLLIATFCFSVIAVGQTYQAVMPIVFREVRYVAAPIVEAAEYIAPKPVLTVDQMLQRIADCESGIRNADGSAVPGSARQFDDEGRPVVNVNKSGSLDFGWAQINTEYHFKQAAKMGLDVVSSEKDNKAFAKYLYERNGTRDWNASRSCWDR